VKTTRFLSLNCLAVAASLAITAIPIQAQAKGDGGKQQAAAEAPAPSRVAAPVVRGVAPGARVLGTPRIGAAHTAPPANRSVVTAPRITSSAARVQQTQQAQPARQRAFQNAAAARALNARNLRTDQNSGRFAERRGRDSDRDHRDHDWKKHDRDWWWRHHRHDRVVFVNGIWLTNPFYDDFYYGYGPGYYSSYYAPAPVYYDVAADDSIAVDIQRELRREGYYRGPIDGVIGLGTRRAIAAFQRDNGLAPTGRINGALLDAMGLT
jgi:hypothetical protein